ncbi:MAG TPA: hypothetical protein VFQ61_06300 [Polyangiaceae bacterium]|nr:hypothetical protein [Polyangiaceae bacterium]
MDVRLTFTLDGAEISVLGGDIVTDDGLETAVMLSLLGGNEQDSGLESDKRRQWWGNFIEADPARRYRSETLYLLNSLPLIPINAKRVAEAAKRDLSWLVERDIARTLATRGSIAGVDRLLLEIALDVNGRALGFRYESVRTGCDVRLTAAETAQ